LVRASITLLFCVRGCIFQLFDKHFWLVLVLYKHPLFL
jgi:hypothetical protein